MNTLVAFLISNFFLAVAFQLLFPMDRAKYYVAYMCLSMSMVFMGIGATY